MGALILAAFFTLENILKSPFCPWALLTYFPVLMWPVGILLGKRLGKLYVALFGIINCAGCPTLAGPDKLLGRIRALTEFRLDTIHFTYCMDVLCPFKAKYKALLEEHFPNIEIIVGTHESHVTNEQFREDVKGLFCQPKRSMVDVIEGR